MELIIKGNDNDFERLFNDEFEKNGVSVVPFSLLYSSNNKIKRRLQIIKSIVNQRRTNAHYDKIIVFDDITVAIYIALLSNSSRKVILWFWNTIKTDFATSIKLLLFKQLGEAYSFDEGDVKKYRIGFNTQVLMPMKYNNEENTSDLVFVGVNKGRYQLVKKIECICKKQGIRNDFTIISDIDDKERIPYLQYIEKAKKSKAILDIVKAEQTGLTLRVLEAIFLDKKIVTNNVNIVNHSFYSKNNTFVIGVDDENNLRRFLDGSISYDPRVKKYYSISNWLKRFKNNEKEENQNRRRICLNY